MLCLQLGQQTAAASVLSMQVREQAATTSMLGLQVREQTTTAVTCASGFGGEQSAANNQGERNYDANNISTHLVSPVHTGKQTAKSFRKRTAT